MAVEYTKAMIAELQAVTVLTFDAAKAFADKNDISVRSVISKARALEVEYQPKVRTTSTAKAEPKETKAEVVADIQERTGVTFKNLGNLVMDDLNTLRDLVQSAE